MKAVLRNYRQAPRKVRLVVDAVRGKTVEDALRTLSFMPKRAAEPVRKLLASAAANARFQGIEDENLVVQSISVDKGLVMRRMMPRAQGRSAPILKRMSHVTVVLGESNAKREKKAAK